MSDCYLCDYCANKAGDSFFRANAVKCWKYPDNVPKNVMHDGIEKPTDVCEHYKPREGGVCTERT